MGDLKIVIISPFIIKETVPKILKNVSAKVRYFLFSEDTENFTETVKEFYFQRERKENFRSEEGIFQFLDGKAYSLPKENLKKDDEFIFGGDRFKIQSVKKIDEFQGIHLFDESEAVLVE